MQLECLMCRCPVTEHDRNRRNDLDLDAETCIVIDTFLRVPGFRPDFAEELAVLVDPVATVFAVVNHRKAVVAVLRGKIRPVAG